MKNKGEKLIRSDESVEKSLLQKVLKWGVVHNHGAEPECF